MNDGWLDSPAGDGVPSIMKFAFDGDPLSAERNPRLRYGILSSPSGLMLYHTAPIRTGAVLKESPALTAEADGIQYVVRGSGNLDFDSQPLPVQEIIPPLLEGLPPANPGWEYRTFATLGGENSAFMSFGVQPGQDASLLP